MARSSKRQRRSLEHGTAGYQASIDKVKSVLDQQRENVFYLVEPGAGRVTKLIHNDMGVTTVRTMSEAFAVVDRTGIDLLQLYDIMSTGASHWPFKGFVGNMP